MAEAVTLGRTKRVRRDLRFFRWTALPTMSATPILGTPNSWFENSDNGQERRYGADGWPGYDIDWNHNHGTGLPHGHNWVGQLRGPGMRLCAFPRGRAVSHRRRS